MKAQLLVARIVVLGVFLPACSRTSPQPKSTLPEPDQQATDTERQIKPAFQGLQIRRRYLRLDLWRQWLVKSCLHHLPQPRAQRVDLSFPKPLVETLISSFRALRCGPLGEP